eukprot:5421467-Pleurochrysis_carterae.AAC.1
MGGLARLASLRRRGLPADRQERPLLRRVIRAAPAGRRPAAHAARRAAPRHRQARAHHLGGGL